MLIKDEHDPSNRPQLVAPTEAIIQYMMSVSKQLTEDQWRVLLRKYDPEEKTGLFEHQWNSLCAENKSIFGVSTGTVVDFGRVSDSSLGSPVRLKRRKTIAEIVIEFLEGFVSGGLAGAISKTVIAPGDRVKIIFQVDPQRHFSLTAAYNVGRQIVKEGGFFCLWMGNGATMMRVIPYASITFMSFEQYHSFLRTMITGSTKSIPGEDQRTAVTCRFMSGALAGATATTFTYPLDLMRARFAAHAGGEHGKKYPSYMIAFRQVIKTEGFFSLYGGLLPTLMGIMPYAGSSFACFETLKHYLVAYQGLDSDKEIPAWQRLVAGGFSGLIAQSCTYPLDIVRRRMQVTPGKYKGLVHALSEIYKNEGVRTGLYKGLAMNWIKGPIAVATSFTVNDIVKSRIRQYHKKADEDAMNRTDGRGNTWFMEVAICGAAAGGVAKFWTTPFDRIKIMYQVGQLAADDMTWGRHARSLMKEMYAETPNMWQGSGAMMIRVIPYAAICYVAFDQFQPMAERMVYSHGPCMLSNFFAGGAAATLATFLLYPLDLLRVRSATAAVKPFDSYYLGMRTLFRTRGITSLWEGAGASILGIGPMAGIGFALYEDLKQRFECDTFAKRLVAGAVAGAVAQLCTYPINVVRRRAQVDSLIHERFVQRMKTIYVEKGFYHGLYERMPFGWTMGATTVGLSFSINDLCKDSITRAKKEIREAAAMPEFSRFLPQPRKDSFGIG